jgi:Family of unknown function (DUF5683)
MVLFLRYISGSILVLFFCFPLRAQLPMRSSLRSALFASSWVQQDTATLTGTIATAGFKATRSPGLAIGLSAVVPGAGQIYAQRYWTLPFIWGFGYWFVRQYRAADRQYVMWRGTYTTSLNSAPPAGFALADIKRIRDFYRDERDRFAFYLALTYVLNLVDAYVGASLYNFDVGENLGATEQLQLRLRIPLH